MAECSYGVVVQKHRSNFVIWLLFRGAESGLTSLDAQLCSDPLRIGDIVQARSETRIRRYWPFSDSVWTDGTRVVIRTIVSYCEDVTVGRGKWRDETTGVEFVLLISRDLGLVSAPVQWCKSEFLDARESHLFLYVQFLPQKFVSLRSEERSEFFWTVMRDRVSLSALPPMHEETDKFVDPVKLRRVPAITMQRLGNSILMWSYALGDRVAFIKDDQYSAIGQWKSITVVPSSPREFSTHGCAYTVLRHEPAVPYTQPEFSIDTGKITMKLTLNRSENSSGGVKLWHDLFGFAVGYDDAQSDWIRGEKEQFVAVVEITMNACDEVDGRRVTIKAIGPLQKKKKPRIVPVARSSTVLEDVRDVKKPVDSSHPYVVESESAKPSEPSQSNNNNDNKRKDQNTGNEKRSLPSPGEKKYESTVLVVNEKSREKRAQRESLKEPIPLFVPHIQPSSPKWAEIPKKEMKSESNGVTEEGLNCGKKEEAERNEENVEGTGSEREEKGESNGDFSSGGRSESSTETIVTGSSVPLLEMKTTSVEEGDEKGLVTSLASIAQPPSTSGVASNADTTIRKSSIFRDRDFKRVQFSYFFDYQIERCLSEQHKLIGPRLAEKENEAEIIYDKSLYDLFSSKVETDSISKSSVFLQLLFGSDAPTTKLDGLIDDLVFDADLNTKYETPMLDLLFVTGKIPRLLEELEFRDAVYDLYDPDSKSELGPMSTFANLLSNSKLQVDEDERRRAVYLVMSLSMLATGQETLVDCALIYMVKVLDLPWDALLLARHYYGADHEITRKVHDAWTEAVLMKDSENKYQMVRFARSLNTMNLKDLAYTLMNKATSKFNGYELIDAYRCLAIFQVEVNSFQLSELEKRLEVAEASTMMRRIFVTMLGWGKIAWAKSTLVDLTRRASPGDIPEDICQIGLTCLVELVELLLNAQEIGTDSSSITEALLTSTAHKWREEMTVEDGKMNKLKSRSLGYKGVVDSWMQQLGETMLAPLFEKPHLDTEMECVFLAVSFLHEMIRWAASAQKGESLRIKWPKRAIKMRVEDDLIIAHLDDQSNITPSDVSSTSSTEDDGKNQKEKGEVKEEQSQSYQLQGDSSITAMQPLRPMADDATEEALQQAMLTVDEELDAEMVVVEEEQSDSPSIPYAQQLSVDCTESEVQERVTSCGVPYSFSPVKNEAVESAVVSTGDQQEIHESVQDQVEEPVQQPVQEPAVNTHIDIFRSVVDATNVEFEGIDEDKTPEAVSARQTSTVSSSVTNTQSEGSEPITVLEIVESASQETSEHDGDINSEIGDSPHPLPQIASPSLPSVRGENRFNFSVLLALVMGVLLVVMGVVFSQPLSDLFSHYRRQSDM